MLARRCLWAFLALTACGGGTTVDAGPDATTGDLGGHDAGGIDFGGTCPDTDSDGHTDARCGGDDCDDADGTTYPSALEVCDAAGHDEDCDPHTLGPDGDGDGAPSSACCDTQPGGALVCGDDCDDTRATIGPTAIEACNGVDDDCDGSTDEGIVRTDYYPDCDGDGFGDASATAMSACATPTAPPTCTATGGLWSTAPTDCRDDFAGIHPGAAAPCTCTGTPWDADGDGFIAEACGGDDCRDTNALSHLRGTETCNGLDDDCDGFADFPMAGHCVPCGGTGCATGVCCVDPSGSAACAASCPSGSSFECDGSEDCPSGPGGIGTCSVSMAGSATMSTVCGTSPPIYACRNNGDCSTATSCMTAGPGTGPTSIHWCV